MVTVSSAFMSSRRERIVRSVLSASGCACKAASWVEVLRADLADADLKVDALLLGKADWDNTDVVRDHSFHCIAGRIRPGLLTILGMWGWWFQQSSPHFLVRYLPPSRLGPGRVWQIHAHPMPRRRRTGAGYSNRLPAAVRVPQPGRRQAELEAREVDP